MFMYHSKDDKTFTNADIQTATPTGLSLFQTVTDNEQMYRPREIRSTKAAQDLSKFLFHSAQSQLEKSWVETSLQIYPSPWQMPKDLKRYMDPPSQH
jgi:hypothetical protein